MPSKTLWLICRRCRQWTDPSQSQSSLFCTVCRYDGIRCTSLEEFDIAFHKAAQFAQHYVQSTKRNILFRSKPKIWFMKNEQSRKRRKKLLLFSQYIPWKKPIFNWRRNASYRICHIPKPSEKMASCCHTSQKNHSHKKVFATRTVWTLDKNSEVLESLALSFAIKIALLLFLIVRTAQYVKNGIYCLSDCSNAFSSSSF